MKPTRCAATALSLIALVSGVAVSANAGARYGQDDAFEKLKSYDYQSREPVAAVQAMIDQNLADKAQTAQIELHLVKLLDDPSTTMGAKEEIGRMLWMIGTAQSVPALSKMLVDEKESNIARYALERNMDPSAARALSAALGKTQGKTLVGIINSIGNRGDAAAAPVLKKYAMSDDPLVMDAAVTALGKIGTPGALAVLQSLKNAGALADHAQLRIAEKEAALGKRSDAEKLYLSLAGEGKPNVIRGEALRGLANLSSPRATTVALADLKSSDAYLQIVGAQVIGRLTDPLATSKAIAAWPTVPASAQVILLTAFGEQKNAAANNIALEATTSTDANVRLAAIRAAGRTGGAKSVAKLVDLATHGQGDERSVARDMLATMPGAEADQAIIGLAKTAAPDVRSALTEVLGNRATPLARAALLEAVEGSEPSVASGAARALGQHGSADDQAKLVHILATTQSDELRDTAREAVVTLGQRLGNRDAETGAVMAAYTSASAAGKASLLSVLSEAGGDQALAALTTATTSDQPQIMQAAVSGLADTWNDSRPLPTLLKIATTASTGKGLRVQALRGYLRLVNQDEGIPADQKVMRVDAAIKAAVRPDEKKYALSILQNVRSAEAVSEAAKLLDDPDVSEDAANTILNLAAAQKRDNKEYAAVKGAITNEALDKVIRITKDDNVKARVRALKF